MWPFRTAQERLDDQAATWLVRMQSADREGYRSDFERWLGASAANAEAYEEAIVSQHAGGMLEHSPISRSRGLSGAPGSRVPVRYALAGVALAVAALALLFLTSAYVPQRAANGQGLARYSASGGERVWLDLPDGSRIKLGGDAAADIAFTGSERRLTLTSGMARFQVAHDSRPFLVEAGDALVTARGTVFDIRLVGARTIVRLIEGSVDVTYRAASGAPERPRETLRLKPGQQVVMGDTPRGATTRVAPAEYPSAGMLEFDGVPLARAVADFNRRSGTRIGLAEPAIGQLRVTGAFRVGDAEAFAQSLAAAFGLNVEREAEGTLLLRSSTFGSARR